jgi:hypothetical protein
MNNKNMDESAQQPQSVPPPEPPPSNPPASQAPLTYEETPVIEHIEPPPKSVKKHSGSCLKTIGIIFLVGVLFVGGIWLSSFVRQFLPSNPSTGTLVTTNSTPTPSASTSADPYATWKVYSVVSGTTKLPISGLQFKLPPDVLSPICDGGSCVSQGTYLPGGTRLTVAARGVGQSLRDYRGTVITDVNGVPIPTKQFTLNNFLATEYDSSASGRTVSGYAFSQMRGVMIPLTDALSVEVNHFTPMGITADFTADDTLFDSIIKTFTYSTVTPAATVTATPTKIATSSGY